MSKVTGKVIWVTGASSGIGEALVYELAKKGAKNILVFSPAFVADCLETIYEIGTEYQEIFHTHGGEKVTLVKSLNSSDAWVKAVKEIVLN